MFFFKFRIELETDHPCLCFIDVCNNTRFSFLLEWFALEAKLRNLRQRNGLPSLNE